eukprot:11593437-Karenia_brevis.AAC.1
MCSAATWQVTGLVKQWVHDQAFWVGIADFEEAKILCISRACLHEYGLGREFMFWMGNGCSPPSCMYRDTLWLGTALANL